MDIEDYSYQNKQQSQNQHLTDSTKFGKNTRQKQQDQTMQYQMMQQTDLKNPCQDLPLWITSDGHVFLETFSPHYKYAVEFLVSIALPESRPAFVHEYIITEYSLYAAMVLQLTPQKILTILQKLCKNLHVPQTVKQFIEKHTQHYGKAKLFLHNSKYYLEISDHSLFEIIMKDQKKRMIEQSVHPIKKHEEARKKLLLHHQPHSLVEENPMIQATLNCIDELIDKPLDEIQEGCERMMKQDEELQDLLTEQKKLQEMQERSRVYQIEGQHFDVTKLFIENRVPIIEEYDYKNCDDQSSNLQIELRTDTVIKQHQEKAISKIFIQGLARSGVVVLPCGAGKTCLGIIATCVIRKLTIVFCDRVPAVGQWEKQFHLFANIQKRNIIQFTSENAEENYSKWKEVMKLNEGIVLITTYSMVVKKREAPKIVNKETKDKTQKREMMDWIKSVDWGLCILDEVQVVPAETFNKSLVYIKAHFKLGLTATLLREDKKIKEIVYMIGPKLYEESWLDLVNKGELARPYCVQVQCPMDRHFLEQYNNPKYADWGFRQHMYAGNPDKFTVLQYLIKKHELRKDKVIVFGEKPKLMSYYAEKLKCPVLHGKVSQEERKTVIKYFMESSKVNTIFLTSVGDTSLDMPDASVIIQIDSMFGSRRQEAQRLGRIMRPKPHDKSLFNAFFYTLVSMQTAETEFVHKRQRFLVDQGFCFEIISELPIGKNLSEKIQFPMDINEREEHLKRVIEIWATNKQEKDDFLSASDDNSDRDEPIRGTQVNANMPRRQNQTLIKQNQR